MFIKLTKTDGSKVVLNLYSIQGYDVDEKQGGTSIRISENVQIIVKERMEEVDELLKESYVYVKERK